MLPRSLHLVQDKDGRYYLVGEGKKVLSDCSECLNLYSSADWTNWRFEGCILNNSNVVAPPPYNQEPYYRMERPKIFGPEACGNKGQYTMWFHCDTSGFAMKSVGVLTAPAITGPWSFVAPCFRPDAQDSYDMGTYFDDPARGGDGNAYLIRSVRNQFAGISQLTPDCLNTTAAGIVSQGPDMEGQVLMRDAQGVLHAGGSHLTGWDPNPAIFVTTNSSTLPGALWGDEINPSGDPTTYDTQSTFIFPYRHADGHTTYMWMADRWNANGPGGLDNMTLVWLPLLPPTSNGSNPAPQPGWVLTAQPCNAADSTQVFTIVSASNTVVHTSSGLCVAQADPSCDPSTGLCSLVLATCDASPAQTWYVGSSGHTLQSTAKNTAAGCVDWNLANNDLTTGNPLIAYTCGSPPAWNEEFILPAANTPAVVTLVGQNWQPSSYCVAVRPAHDPTQWQLPWLDQWSLKDY